MEEHFEHIEEEDDDVKQETPKPHNQKQKIFIHNVNANQNKISRNRQHGARSF